MEYEEELRRRQREHLQQTIQDMNWRSCLHDKCPECIGTGIKKTGGMCVHHISCPCPKCTPSY
jgi:excinuclease UvrABC ATPase subunit